MGTWWVYVAQEHTKSRHVARMPVRATPKRRGNAEQARGTLKNDRG